MDQTRLNQLEQFIVFAKSKTYVGDGQKLLPYRLDSHDLQVIDGEWSYHDSYFGGADFLGQEIVYYQHTAVWGMNYYGMLLQPDRITAAEIGQMINKSLTRMYAEGRFLGGFEHAENELRYVDQSEGPVSRFTGKEVIYLNGDLVYQLHYHGGMINI
ncbi:MAG TPA: DUF5680 domain-containing protein [Anaerolineales bacterium]|nr:DUF5680 domain-containing protein [Anaerolineales bacterium]